MNITTTSLTRAAGAPLRSPDSSSSGSRSTTRRWTCPPSTPPSGRCATPPRWSSPPSRSTASPACTCARCAQTGWLGLVGCVLSAAGSCHLAASRSWRHTSCRPWRTPRPVRHDVLVAAEGGTPVGDIGLMQGVVRRPPGVAYVVDGVTLGVALFRARVLARWASALLAVGGVATGLLAVLPDRSTGRWPSRRRRPDRPRQSPCGATRPRHPPATQSRTEAEATDVSRGLPPSIPAPSDDRRRGGPSPARPGRPGHGRGPRGWPVPVAMIGPVGRPAAAGALRLVRSRVSPELSRRTAASPTPGPLVLHVVGAAVYALVGIFQSCPASGAGTPPGTAAPASASSRRVVAVAGSALWMTLCYGPEPGTGDLLYVLRPAFGPAMVASLVLGITAIRRGDVAAPPSLDDPGVRHRARCRHANVHRRHRRRPLRHRCGKGDLAKAAGGSSTSPWPNG